MTTEEFKINFLKFICISSFFSRFFCVYFLLPGYFIKPRKIIQEKGTCFFVFNRYVFSLELFVSICSNKKIIKRLKFKGYKKVTVNFIFVCQLSTTATNITFL
ncbi:hypothetical protein HMPREF9489_0788 [Finegoldia magna SY403409CC001050417]|nr:hypothetical protein HMPREF9489_0788 [Finegoldia magna SY403409CC001050417]